MGYFNTTSETAEYLRNLKAKAGHQDLQVLRVIEDLDDLFSCSDLFERLKDYPVTSIRRSVNTLLRKGVIEKTGDKVKSVYGRNEFQYRLR